MRAIDLHSHILPGLDDGAPDRDASLAMAERAIQEGIGTIVATPHVNWAFSFPLEDIVRLVGELNAHLARAGMPLGVLPGGEIDLSRLVEMSDEDLRKVSLGGTDWLLVEAPYANTPIFVEDIVEQVRARGFEVVLAHPERSRLFQGDPGRLSSLAANGALLALNAGSMAGHFGSTAERYAGELLAQGLVHCVASDSHDASRRPPALRAGFERADRVLPGIGEQMDWFTERVPRALLSRHELPPRPPPVEPKRSLWRRLLRR